MAYIFGTALTIFFIIWLVFSIYAGVLMAKMPYNKAKQQFHWTMLIFWWYGFSFWVLLALTVIFSFVFVFTKIVVFGAM